MRRLTICGATEVRQRRCSRAIGEAAVWRGRSRRPSFGEAEFLEHVLHRCHATGGAVLQSGFDNGEYGGTVEQVLPRRIVRQLIDEFMRFLLEGGAWGHSVISD